jgi:hypothetical protein
VRGWTLSFCCSRLQQNAKLKGIFVASMMILIAAAAATNISDV